jgi:CRISPR-associated endonuclease/helicase Cas3
VTKRRPAALVGKTVPTFGDAPRPADALWGKWGDQGDGRSPLPLLAHLLDTAALGSEIWDRWCSAPVRRAAALLLADGDERLAGERFAVLAGLHDCGKADPIFQGRQRWRDRSRFDEHAARLAGLGLEMKTPGVCLDRNLHEKFASHLRHEAVSAYLLTDRAGLPDWAATVVAGHHGRYQVEVDTDILMSPVGEHYRTLATPAWAAAHDYLINAVTLAVTGQPKGPGGFVGWRSDLPVGVAQFLPALTGMVCLADWLASDETFVSTAPVRELTDPQRYLESRRVGLAEHVGRTLGYPTTLSGTFEDVFGGKTPNRPAQEWAVRTVHGPGLTVLMNPMGDGKTEAALWIHKAGQSGDGLVFALPTTATADKMFDRVRELHGGIEGLAHLAHGRAILNSFYAPSAASPVSVRGDETQTGIAGGLQPGDFFAGAHRGLTAPVTVGTCDQVLAAALSHKYVAVRLAALAGKHVVLDEVHTYDPYQDALLIRLLGWLGAYRTRVTILSATLPTQRLTAYAKAWSDGWNSNDPDAAPFDASGLVGQYPAIVRVTDHAELTPVAAHRRYRHMVRTHRMRGEPSAFLSDTAALTRTLRVTYPVARIGVIVNTVDRCIQLARDLDTAAVPVQVLHSRMPGRQRSDSSDQLEATCGKNAPAGPVLVVATQVAEASLDIDFDVLVTDLAPMASMLQRAGRQWRHSVPVGAGWEHPEHLSYRTGDPVLHVCVPVALGGRLEQWSVLPYTMAELSKAWLSQACLAGGDRTSFAIPAELQAAVDAGNVILQDLQDAGGELDQDQVGALRADLAGQMAKKAQGDQVGVSVDAFARQWTDEQNPVDSLVRLTSGVLRSEEAQTRLRETVQANVILCDSTGETSGAWHGTPEGLLDRFGSRCHPAQQSLIEVSGLIIPVSGRIATALTAAAPIEQVQWERQSHPLLSRVVAVPLSAADETVFLHPRFGLVNTERR